MHPNPIADTSRLLFPSLRFCIVRPLRGLGLVLFVAYLLHPVDRLAVEIFQNRDVSHGSGRSRTVPMLFAGRTPDYIAGPDFFLGSTPTLRPAASGGHDQGLPQRMCMPRRARAGFERDTHAEPACRLGCLEQRVDADGAGEVLGRSSA